MRPRRVVVTGLGMVTPLGIGVSATWKALLARECGIQRLEKLQALPTQIAAPVDRGSGGFDASSCSLMEKGDEANLSDFIHFALAASGEALNNSGWDPQSDAQRERTGVALGSGIGGLGDTVETAYLFRERGHRRISPHFIPKILVNMGAGWLSL